MRLGWAAKPRVFVRVSRDSRAAGAMIEGLCPLWGVKPFSDAMAAAHVVGSPSDRATSGALRHELPTNPRASHTRPAAAGRDARGLGDPERLAQPGSASVGDVDRAAAVGAPDPGEVEE